MLTLGFKTNVMIAFYNIIVGLIATFFIGLGVGPLVRYVQKAIPLIPPSESLKENWNLLTTGNESGFILGNLERFLFFGAFWNNVPLIIVGWLAFKVASKWNAWTNIISIPKEISGVDPLNYLISRRRWGSQLLSTFLVGTLSNVIIGFLGGYY